MSCSRDGHIDECLFLRNLIQVLQFTTFLFGHAISNFIVAACKGSSRV